MLAGRIGHVVPDVAAEPALADLTWPAEIGVNAYLGVPLRTADTRLYLLCCLARERRPDLGAADVNFVRASRSASATTSPDPLARDRRGRLPAAEENAANRGSIAEARLRSRLAKLD